MQHIPFSLACDEPKWQSALPTFVSYGIRSTQPKISLAQSGIGLSSSTGRYWLLMCLHGWVCKFFWKLSNCLDLCYSMRCLMHTDIHRHHSLVNDTYFYYSTTPCYRGICRSHMCLSVASWHSAEMAKRRLIQIMPHDSPGTLVFWCCRSWQNSDEITRDGGAKCRYGRLKLATFNK